MGLSDQLNMPLALEKLDGPTQADPHPSQLPQPLLELLVYSNLDWISPSWTSTFNSIFSQQSPRVPCAPTHQASSDTSVSALKHQTIKCYLSGVRFYLITHSYANPFANDLPKLQYVLRGIKIQEGILGCTQKPRLPVTPKILLTIHNVLSQHVCLHAVDTVAMEWIWRRLTVMRRKWTLHVFSHNLSYNQIL